MSNLFLAMATLGLFALAAPASAMPAGKIATDVANTDAGIIQVHSRRHFRRHYRPQIVLRYSSYRGGPYYSGSCLGRVLYGIGPCYSQTVIKERNWHARPHRRLHPVLIRRAG
jgi:hypothetical protein